MPKLRSKEHTEQINDKLIQYIKKTPIPIVAEFAYKNGIRRQLLYENPVWKDTIKTLIDKKEAQLERLGLSKEIDKTMAIFSLKQLGWKDVQDFNVGFNATETAKEFAALVSAAGAGSATPDN